MKRRRAAKPVTKPLGRVASHFNRNGLAKNSYRTQSEARSAAQLAWTLSRVDLDSYRCDHCFQWHIGKRFRDD
jgi:hypothetical protein